MLYDCCIELHQWTNSGQESPFLPNAPLNRRTRGFQTLGSRELVRVLADRPWISSNESQWLFASSSAWVTHKLAAPWPRTPTNFETTLTHKHYIDTDQSCQTAPITEFLQYIIIQIIIWKMVISHSSYATPIFISYSRWSSWEQVQDTLFRVHRHFFEVESQFFLQEFAKTPKDGISDSSAFRLDKVTIADFSNFLWVWYSP